MLDIQKIDHVGIRIGERDRSVSFYQALGFSIVTEAGYKDGHPIVMRHPSGLVVNLLGPANTMLGENILMDRSDKRPGITHFAVKVASIEATNEMLDEADIAITDRRSFMGVDALFVRDPDRTVIEIIGPGPDVADLIAKHNAKDDLEAKN
ncbi:MAG: VOC family protein [Hyphomicrobiaceae bacterium]